MAGERDKDEVGTLAESDDLPMGSQGTQAAHNPSSYVNICMSDIPGPQRTDSRTTQLQSLVPSSSLWGRWCDLDRLPVSVPQFSHLLDGAITFLPLGLFLGQGEKMSSQVTGHIYPSNNLLSPPISPNLT